MKADKQQPVVIAVATHDKHLASHVDRRLNYVGLSAVAVRPTADDIYGHIGESQPGLVVLDALQNGLDALGVAKVLAESRPLVKVVILGRRPDLALVAKAVLAGASHFLLDSTPPDEFGKAIADLVAGKHASEECLYGRVYAELPVPTGKDDSFRTRSGRRLTADEAVTQCDQLGIGVDEIADYLHVPIGNVEHITKKARTSPKPSLLNGILTALVPDVSSGSSGLPSIRTTLTLLALLATTWATVSFARQRPTLDRFVTVKGTAMHADGRPLAKDTALMFGLQPRDRTVPPSYCGVARVIDAAGAFSTTLRLSKDDSPPYSFRVAILGPSLLPLDSGVIPSQCSDLASTPLRVATSDENIEIRCPSPHVQ